MKTKKSICYVLLFLTISVSAQYKRRTYSNPELNLTVKTEIGETIIVNGQEDYQDAIKILQCPEFKINFVKFPYSVGDILPFLQTRKKHDLYFNPSKKEYLDSGTIGIAYDKEKNIYVPYIDSYNGFITKDQKGNLKVENTTYTNPDCHNCFKKVFIYNGRAGSVVNFTYREFVNNMARPAFTQDLQYDLNEGRIVGFKGLRIEVLNTTNTDIEYVIHSNFN